jgi:hypothetical protein
VFKTKSLWKVLGIIVQTAKELSRAVRVRMGKEMLGEEGFFIPLPS